MTTVSGRVKAKNSVVRQSNAEMTKCPDGKVVAPIVKELMLTAGYEEDLIHVYGLEKSMYKCHDDVDVPTERRRNELLVRYSSFCRGAPRKCLKNRGRRKKTTKTIIPKAISDLNKFGKTLLGCAQFFSILNYILYFF